MSVEPVSFTEMEQRAAALVRNRIAYIRRYQNSFDQEPNPPPNPEHAPDKTEKKTSAVPGAVIISPSYLHLPKSLPEIFDNKYTLDAIGIDNSRITSIHLGTNLEVQPVLKQLAAYFIPQKPGEKSLKPICQKLWTFFQNEVMPEKALEDESVDQLTTIPQKLYLAGHLIKVDDTDLTVRIGLWTDGGDPDPVIEILYFNPERNERQFYTYRPGIGLSRKGESQKLTAERRKANPLYTPPKELPIAFAIALSIETGKTLEAVVRERAFAVSVRTEYK